MSWHKASRLRIVLTIRTQLEDKIREVLKDARGRSLTKIIIGLTPILRGWMVYFKLIETKSALEVLAGWLRRRLRRILRRQRKHPYPCAMNLMKAGLKEERVFRSAFN
jgi:RNA-directed DNA polymerase